MIKIVTYLFSVWLALDKSTRHMQLKQITREGTIKNTQTKSALQVGKYAAEYDIISSVRKYRPNFPKIKESTITEFKRKYEVQMKHSKNNAGQEAAEGKTAEKSSRSLLSGKLDGMVQTYIRSASNCGAFVPR